MQPSEKLLLRWPVFPEYEVSEKWVRVKGHLKVTETTPFCVPAEMMELPAEIAKLERGNTKAVLDFTRRYGLLGFFELSAEDSDAQYGDPLSWIWRHAETLGLCMRLKHLLDNDDVDGIHRALASFPQALNSSLLPAPLIRYSERAKSRRTWFFPVGNEESQCRNLTRLDILRDLAGSILCHVINANIAFIHPLIGWGQLPFQFQKRFFAVSLIEQAYWHVANALVAHQPLTQCKQCGHYFIQTHRARSFCPTGTKKESPCAILFRVRKYRVNTARTSTKHGTKGQARSGVAKHATQKGRSR